MKAREPVVCLAQVNFLDLYNAVTEVFEDFEVHWVAAENILCGFLEKSTVSEVASKLARVSPDYASWTQHQLKN